MIKTQTNTAKKQINIEDLLAKKSQITNAALTAALNKLEEKKQQDQEAQLIEHLQAVQKNTDIAVENLRSARLQEKKQKAYLTAVAEAQAKFYSDGDIDAYNKAITAARMA